MLRKGVAPMKCGEQIGIGEPLEIGKRKMGKECLQGWVRVLGCYFSFFIFNWLG
ncbi:hypothetical protein AHAS_Ahas16G0196700 [Arachis hypogaea]